MTFDVGSRLRDYEIIARLKAGGMATLFLARRTGAAGFSRHVAMKVVHPHLAADPSFVRMFIDEALLSARIQHPNVVHVEELGEEQGSYFLAMEYVHGSALSTLLGQLARLERRLSPELSVWIACQVLDGLHAAHELRDETGQALGVVHRDVSPQNVLVSTSGHVKLIDFGIAKVQGQGKRTETGSLKGKIRYMSPEQAHGQPVDRRTDLYALAIVLWEMLTMHRMFGTGNDLAVLDMVRSPRPEVPSRFAPGISSALDRALLFGLAPRLEDRPSSALDLKRALLEALPSAATVDASQLADIMAAVLGDRMEARKHALPASLTGLQLAQAGATAPGRRSLAKGDALAQLTVSAPGVKFTADQDVSEVPGPFTEGSKRLVGGAAATAPGAAAPSGLSVERVVAIASGAIALVALGVAGGVLVTRPDAPSAPGPAMVATPLAPPAAAVPEPRAEVATVPATVAPDAGSDAGVAAADEPRAPSRRRRPPTEEARDRSVLGGVPIYDDDF